MPLEKFSTREANEPLLPEEVFFAGTMLLGCRVGLNKRYLAIFWLSLLGHFSHDRGGAIGEILDLGG